MPNKSELESQAESLVERVSKGRDIIAQDPVAWIENGGWMDDFGKEDFPELEITIQEARRNFKGEEYELRDDPRGAEETEALPYITSEVAKAADISESISIEMYRSKICGDYRFVTRFKPENNDFGDKRHEFKQRLQDSLKGEFIVYHGYGEVTKVERVEDTEEFEVTMDVSVCDLWKIAKLRNYAEVINRIN